MAANNAVQLENCPKQTGALTPSRVPAPAALILVDSSARPIYCSSEAITLLGYARPVNRENGAPCLPPEVRSWLQRNMGSAVGWRTLEFLSGRRRYTCRAFPLINNRAEKRLDSLTALLLERKCGNSIHNLDLAQFRLTQREEETVSLLTLGLTSKEIATRMNISPNTVKAFFRLVMTKMGVTTRSGIVGRVAGL